MLEGGEGGRGGEHPAAEHLDRVLIRALVDDLQEGGALGRLLGRRALAEASSDPQRTEAHGLAHRRLEGGGARSDLIKALHDDHVGFDRRRRSGAEPDGQRGRQGGGECEATAHQFRPLPPSPGPVEASPPASA